MLFGVEITEQTTVLGLIVAALSALTGAIVYVFKVVIPANQRLSDVRFDMMLDKFVKEVETGRMFLRDELLKRDIALTNALDRFGAKMEILADRVAECPNRGIVHYETNHNHPTGVKT